MSIPIDKRPVSSLQEVITTSKPTVNKKSKAKRVALSVLEQHKQSTSTTKSHVSTKSGSKVVVSPKTRQSKKAHKVGKKRLVKKIHELPPKSTLLEKPILPKTHIAEQASLFAGSRALKKSSQNQPLVPSNMGKDTVHDVYMRETMVFKPVKTAADRSETCYGLARLVDISSAVVPAKKGQATVIASQDVNLRYEINFDDDGEKTIVVRHFLDDEVDPKKKKIVTSSEGIKIKLTAVDENEDNEPLFSIEILDTVLESESNHLSGSDKHDRLFTIKKDDESGEMFLELDNDTEESNKVHDDDQGKYVLRNGVPYRLIPKGEGLHEVVGQDIEGMVQARVPNVFVGASSQKPLNILTASSEVNKFYSRIDMPSFIECFLAIMLLRPQDGKVTGLDESNVLFSEVNPGEPDSPLKPVLIDLDETMPPNNDYSQDPHVAPRGSADKVHVVRNGLMAFPQALEMLKGSNKEGAVAAMKKIISQKGIIEKFLLGRLGKDFKKSHVDACLQVIGKMESFLAEKGDAEWSLQQLFFHVFPEYEEQWNRLGTEPEAYKAMLIGKESDKSIKERIARQRRLE